MEQDRKSKQIDLITFLILLMGVSAVTLFLFNRQTHGSPELYHSDMKAYILEMQGLESKYNFPYPVFFKLAALIYIFFPEPELAVAIATMLLNSFAIVILKFFFNKIILKKVSNSFSQSLNWMGGVMVSLLTFALFFVSMLYKKGGIYRLGINYIYLGVFTPNPFHNATYLAARPFAILSFFFFVMLLERYENGFSGYFGTLKKAFWGKNSGEKVDLVEYMLFSGSLLIATMTKPSFTILLVGAAGIVMLYRLLCRFFSRTNRSFENKSLKEYIISVLALGFCFIPTFIDLLYQYKGVFVPAGAEEGGIGFAPGKVWNLYSGCIPASVCLACGFPICVLLLNFKEAIKDTKFRFAWEIYGMGFFTAYFFYEKGFRWADFNFSWGYGYGLFFSFVCALLFLVKKSTEKQKNKRQRVLILIQWLVFAAHFICGILYFAKILRGEMYY